ncbi:SDR family oxidoreductase [Azohydromonas caseinilytica]|uniref:SDR family oxidoreductase n=1 Tax=Azohydromonas caseinilytica TaxID=2728836 RepID=A0A848F5W6_9BURK|nr:SDR family oxidoreductase [Azohydromonas caseinilytica]NML13501.1 SDR family oxidoreductase [Azohydromonas caseinilytica]
MKVLLTGATGFIGSRLRQALLDAGHSVVAVSRHAPTAPQPPRLQWLALDFARALTPAQWLPYLQGVDAVVNAVGIFREAGSQTFEALHHRAPVALFQACAQAGVRRVVQISALGVAAGTTAYQRSKHAADEALRALPLDATVVQPSLVFGEDGPSARFFLTLSSLPLLALPRGGPLQPVHVDDAVAALAALLQAPAAAWAGRRVALVGPQPLSLTQYLQALRAAQGLPRAPVLSVPGPLAAWGARIAGRLGSSLLDEDSWHMLQQGNAAPADDITRLLGRPPRPAQAFIPRARADAARAQARLAWTLWLLRLSLALVWLITAAVSYGLYPVQQSYELLARTGVPPALQPLMLYGAATFDLALGVLTLWPLRPRARRWLWGTQAALIGFYTVLITWRLPEFWLHPYGPLTKNLPILAALALLAALEPRGSQATETR